MENAAILLRAAGRPDDTALHRAVVETLDLEPMLASAAFLASALADLLSARGGVDATVERWLASARNDEEVIP